jgi:hypothetical protein
VNRPLSVVALILSIVALFLGIHAQIRVERIAAETISNREQQLIEWMWPKVERVSVELGAGRDMPAARPNTIEELLSPLFEVLEVGDD